MKWLLLFPIWVFLLSYVMHRVREANREPAAPPEDVGPAPAPVPVPPKPDVPAVREAVLGGAAVEQVAAGFAAAVELVPVAQDAAQLSPLWPVGGLGQPALQLASRASFDRWQLFEGQGVSFYLPAGVGLTVEEVDAAGLSPAVGEIFYQTGSPTATWYRIVAPGDVTWAALSVDREGRFDFRERYPTGEVFHKLLLAGGAACRVSLAGDGRPGRVQWLADGVRVSLLEWQHCVAHRSAYVGLAATVRLEAAADPQAQRGLLAGAASGGGLGGRMGLLERGMGAAQIEELLGRPAGVDGSVLIYDTPRREGGMRYRVPLVDGEFISFGDGWRTPREDPPVPGEVDWMLEKTEIRAGEPGGVGYDLGALTDEDVERILSEVRLRLPGADGREWGDLCRVLANLSELRVQDERALQLVRIRFLERGLPSSSAIIVLRSWDPAGAKGLFVQKVEDMLSAPGEAGGAPGEDLRLMLAYVGKRHPEAAGLVKRAAQSRRPDVRSVGYSFWRWFEDPWRHPLLARGVRDEVAGVRRRCAEAFATECGTAADLEPLRAALEAEVDPEAREHLRQAIDRLGGQPPAGE